MSVVGRQWEILGAWLGGLGVFQGGRVSLSFDDRVVALYGLNGAGKTTLLSLLEEALLGIRPEPEIDEGEFVDSTLDVHIRLRGTEFESGQLPGPLQECVDRRIRQLEMAVSTIPGLTAADPPLTRFVESHLSECAHHDDREPDVLNQVWAEALREAAALGCLTLSANGTPERPSWDVYLAVSTTAPHGELAFSTSGQRLDHLGPKDTSSWPPRVLSGMSSVSPFPPPVLGSRVVLSGNA